jgi:hypothetical protein
VDDPAAAAEDGSEVAFVGVCTGGAVFVSGISLDSVGAVEGMKLDEEKLMPP